MVNNTEKQIKSFCKTFAGMTIFCNSNSENLKFLFLFQTDKQTEKKNR